MSKTPHFPDVGKIGVELHKIAKRVLSLSRNVPLTVRIQKKEGLLARYSHQGIHQNTFQDLFTYCLERPAGDGFLMEESSDTSHAGIRGAVERLLSRGDACVAPTMPPPHSQHYRPIKDWFPFDLKKAAGMAEAAIGKTISRLREIKASAHGYYSAYQRHFFVANSAGLRAHHAMTAVRFAVTVSKGVGKGYAAFFSPDPRRLQTQAVFDAAFAQAEATSRKEIRLESGEYDCVFSPRALLEFLSSLSKHFDAKLYHDGRSALSGRRPGQLLFSKAVSLEDNAYLAGQSGIPFDAEGSPRKRVSLVTRGRLAGLLAGSGLSCACHKQPTGHTARGILEEEIVPQNLVMPAGNRPLAAILKSIKRGVFINKIWYHQIVHEKGLVVTGTATAGTCLIENGKVAGCAVRVRYHDSLLRVLQEVVELSRERGLIKDGEYGAALLPYLRSRRLRLEPA